MKRVSCGALKSRFKLQPSSIDSDIEGLSRDPQADQLVAEMDAAGIDVEQQIERLKAYFLARRDRT